VAVDVAAGVGIILEVKEFVSAKSVRQALGNDDKVRAELRRKTEMAHRILAKECMPRLPERVARHWDSVEWTWLFVTSEQFPTFEWDSDVYRPATKRLYDRMAPTSLREAALALTAPPLPVEGHHFSRGHRRVTVGALEFWLEALALNSDAGFGLPSAAPADAAGRGRAMRAFDGIQAPSVPETASIDGVLAANHVAVTHYDYDSGELTLYAESLPFRSVFPCIQSFLIISRIRPEIHSFRMYEAGGATQVLRLDRATLDTVLPLWTMAREWFHSMPTQVWLPAVIAIRRTREGDLEAVKSARYFALNSAVAAFDEIDHSLGQASPIQLVRLGRHLSLATTALREVAAEFDEAQRPAFEEAIAALSRCLARFDPSAGHVDVKGLDEDYDDIERLWREQPTRGHPLW
jgi:hypothetical protein